MMTIILLFDILILVAILSLFSFVEFFISKALKKKAKEVPTGGGWQILYSFGVIALIGCIFFYFNIGGKYYIEGHKFATNLYLYSGVIAATILFASNMFYADNNKVISKVCVKTFLIILNLVFICLYLNIGLSFVAVAGSSDRAIEILFSIIKFSIILSVIAYCWYLVTYLCFRFFKAKNVFIVSWLLFIVYFVSVPAVLYSAYKYAQYKQDHNVYTINLEFENGQRFQIKTPGKFLKTNGYVIDWYCNKDTLICNAKRNSINFDFSKFLSGEKFISSSFFNYQNSLKLKEKLGDSYFYFSPEKNRYLANSFYGKNILKKEDYFYKIGIQIRCKDKKYFDQNKERIKDKLDNLVKQISIRAVN
ncbi:hypothetical protein [Francisella uliginis]|uniref:Uncharacterized protein n=1 Tax=Francisella uliginis TaxID=573570 RepID=A0A1L4BSE1_9GAMM|nr:hypothetical protein [Francisella uliginis]API86761.1 hypothetical protein F7310_05035 [Francisella uliginis]